MNTPVRMTYPLRPDHHFTARRPSRPRDSLMRKALLFVSESPGNIPPYLIPSLSHRRRQPARSCSPSYIASVYPQFLPHVTIILILTRPFKSLYKYHSYSYRHSSSLQTLFLFPTTLPCGQV
ncbi:hypothetical protein BDR05DRAFT_59434 [Suillus weaverae]|nr:hypothetical protein BDR05DRAFT_59434 [Suillus weaverae]